MTTSPAPTGGPTDGVTRVELPRLPSPAPGWEIVQGEVSMEFDNRPALRLHSGEPFLIPTGVVHNARNVGTVTTKMLSSAVIDATKPLVTKH